MASTRILYSVRGFVKLDQWLFCGLPGSYDAVSPRFCRTYEGAVVTAPDDLAAAVRFHIRIDDYVVALSPQAGDDISREGWFDFDALIAYPLPARPVQGSLGVQVDGLGMLVTGKVSMNEVTGTCRINKCCRASY